MSILCVCITSTSLYIYIYSIRMLFQIYITVFAHISVNCASKVRGSGCATSSLPAAPKAGPTGRLAMIHSPNGLDRSPWDANHVYMCSHVYSVPQGSWRFAFCRQTPKQKTNSTLKILVSWNPKMSPAHRYVPHSICFVFPIFLVNSWDRAIPLGELDITAGCIYHIKCIVAFPLLRSYLNVFHFFQKKQNTKIEDWAVALVLPRALSWARSLSFGQSVVPERER